MGIFPENDIIQETEKNLFQKTVQKLLLRGLMNSRRLMDGCKGGFVVGTYGFSCQYIIDASHDIVMQLSTSRWSNK